MSEIVWENEKYLIKVENKKAFAIEKETGVELANTILLGDLDNTKSTLKKAIIFHELGNPTSKLIWENGEYRLEFSGFGWDDLYLYQDRKIVGKFQLDSFEVINVIKKVLAFL